MTTEVNWKNPERHLASLLLLVVMIGIFSCCCILMFLGNRSNQLKRPAQSIGLLLWVRNQVNFFLKKCSEQCDYEEIIFMMLNFLLRFQGCPLNKTFPNPHLLRENPLNPVSIDPCWVNLTMYSVLRFWFHHLIQNLLLQQSLLGGVDKLQFTHNE